MEVRNAVGRRVSLLNDLSFRQPDHSQYAASRTIHSAVSPRSGWCSHTTPELWRSESNDSQMSNADATSPLTPSGDYDYPSSASARRRKVADGSIPRRPIRLNTSRANSQEDESGAPVSDRRAKRYPCRFRDSHGLATKRHMPGLNPPSADRRSSGVVGKAISGLPTPP